ncbi:MAG: response regulator [Nitrospira sp.]|nr:response regulator [Nitrospira sp.]MBS0168288.1 response regulator [Nitrospira sp.]
MPKILIADDSIAVRKVAERLLAEAGFSVMLAANGEEALAYLAKERPDVVVSDVIMPDKSGYEVCAFVRGQPALATTPVLLISGIVNDEVTRQAESCRADGVLKKPFQGTSLKDRVFELLAKRQEASRPAPSSPHSAQEAAPENILPALGDSLQSGPQETGQINEFERQLQVERTRSEELTKRVADLTTQLARAKENESQLTMERQRVSSLQQKLTMLEQQIARIPELEAAVKSEQDVVNSLKQAMVNAQTLSGRVEELESSLDTERAAAEQLVQQLADLEGISAKVKETEARLANDQQQILELQHARASLQAELLTERKSRTETAERIHELETTAARIQALEGLLASERERNEGLTQRAVEAEQSAESATKRFEEMVRKLGEIAGLASQLGSRKGQP